MRATEENNQVFKWPFLAALVLHGLLLFFILFHLNFSDRLPSLGNPNSVIHANLISAQQLAAMTQTKTPSRASVASASQPTPTDTPKPVQQTIPTPPVVKPTPKPVIKPTPQQASVSPTHAPQVQAPQPKTMQLKPTPNATQQVVVTQKQQSSSAQKQQVSKQQANNQDKQQALQQLLHQADSTTASQQLNQITKQASVNNNNPSKQDNSKTNNSAQADAKAALQQLQAEGAQLSAQQNQAMNSEIDKYKAQILNAIAQNWLIPDNSNPNLSAILSIELAPGGVVLNVALIKSSGNPALDRSAMAAVYKSSPLPVPTDTTAFNNFRQFNLTVRPENVM